MKNIKVNQLNITILKKFSTNQHKTIEELIGSLKNQNNKLNTKNKDEIEKLSYLYFILKHNKSISFCSLAIIFCVKDLYFLSFLSICLGSFYLVKSNSNYLRSIKFTEDAYVDLKKPDINNAMKEIIKYIYNHPNLGLYYNENNSFDFMTTWGVYKKNELGNSFTGDYYLNQKRYSIISHMLLEDNQDECLYITSTVLFFTPSHFRIEYLHVKRVGITPNKSYLIIDGRREGLPLTTDDLDVKNIDKRIYSKYREEDNIDYKI